MDDAIEPAAGAASGETGYTRLAQTLRGEILDGTLAPEHRLKITDLARRFGTSANPVREALQMLEGEGLVTIYPNRGASVRAVTGDLVQNIFDIRGLLEPYLVRAFVEYATPQSVADLQYFQDGCEEALTRSSHADFHRWNIRLHDYITDHHHNTEAVAIMKKHNGWLRALSVRRPLTLAQMRRSSEEHRALIAAIARGDADGAVAVIQLHMANSRTVFMDGMRRHRHGTGSQAPEKSPIAP